MNMFDIKNRNNPSMDKYMDPKKPPFGGPNERIEFDPKKKTKYQRVIDRDKNFEGGEFNRNYDTTWKAITRDLVSRSVNKKEYNPMYAKPTIATTKAVDEGRIMKFEEFINESNAFFEEDETSALPLPNDEPLDDEPIDDEPIEDMSNMDLFDADEEQVENVLADYGDQIDEIISTISDEMEIDPEEAAKLVLCAIKKTHFPDEEPTEDDEEPIDEEPIDEEPEEDDDQLA